MSKRREFPAEADFLKGWEWNCFGRFVCDGATNDAGRLVHEFTPTRYELRVLVQHYLQRLDEIEWAWVEFGEASSNWNRFSPFAQRRLATIKKHIGDEEFDEAVASFHRVREHRQP